MPFSRPTKRLRSVSRLPLLSDKRQKRLAERKRSSSSRPLLLLRRARNRRKIAKSRPHLLQTDAPLESRVPNRPRQSKQTEDVPFGARALHLKPPTTNPAPTANLMKGTPPSQRFTR